MNILVTGATGYIGKRLIPFLLNEGHTVICVVRDKLRAEKSYAEDENILVVEADFLKPETLKNIPKKIDVAYYLIHSMSNSSKDFESLEERCAINFKDYIETTDVKQVIYLSGITNEEKLSKHLRSRKNVEERLSSKQYALTIFKAGIIVGSGSSSFEIIRDLVEKLPFMIAPKWLNTKTQPLAVRDVLSFLTKAAGNKTVYNASYDVFGPEIITYKEMLLQFAQVRGLKRYILTVPVMTPKLSSYWLYFVTSTSYKLATSLVDSMGVQIIGKKSNINELLNVKPLTYKEAVELAFEKIEQNSIVSSWKDSMVSSGRLRNSLHKYVNVPKFGCFTDYKEREVIDAKQTIDKIWSIGGKNGWYYGTVLWRIRGYIDKLFGGIGLRRGRTSPTQLDAGDALDFWRVIFADKKQQKLLLYAEMRLPGEAWLEFKIEDKKLKQTATFRPRGLWGRLYWYAVLPFHGFIFTGMINKLVNVEPQKTTPTTKNVSYL
ncbi:SDR family oxidoreductase [Jejuia pallidilutea]|uniref:Probable oxidoreductase-putative NAD-dependent nucleoside-diphosphate-sugar epimerase n=1 Tax=Jejuia pallidilutea TaxID=504487 RepID=A0A090VYL8_9FLAO|nr:SDR family oxidoreductase [Jejuia pallidilutea]GAL68998.1 probable oxidoreductase-putative NAD-dependent nucleoside-diphosphate-sugar epimerase [Jejuia pallidilutea]GAL89548.1 probable oxidoreductase-putative NAD-dependent nucleoside-diphosphate-sugar epimerase [Jejuia pallidilutea]